MSLITGYALIAREKTPTGERRHYVCPCLFAHRENAEAHLRESHAKLVNEIAGSMVVTLGVELVNASDDRDVWRSFDVKDGASC